MSTILDNDALLASFAALPETASLVLDARSPDFLIVAATDEYLRVTLTDRTIVGQPLFQALTDDPMNPEATGVANLRRSLATVQETRAAHRMPVQRYDIRRADGSWEVRHWAPLNSPVLAPDGTVRHIIHLVRDVTAEVLGREALARSERLAARTLERMSDAHAVLARDYAVLSVNRAAERAIGLPAERMIGRKPWEIFTVSSEPLARACRRVIEDGIEQHVSRSLATDGGAMHLEIDAYPTDEGGVALFWRDVTERVAALRELHDAAVRKDEFLATLSHELRNPLAPLRHGLKILELAPGSAAARKALVTMERQLAHMARLIEDLMDVSRITRGKMALRRAPLDLRSVVREAVEAGRPLAEAAGHRLTSRVADEPLPLLADETRLVQVVGNLISNAAKYTPAGGAIEVGAWPADGEAVLQVRDTGLGIPAADRVRIFDMFTQLETSPTRPPQGGLGLGLAIVRQIVGMHGGSVSADSAGPGQGSTFTVRLPLAVPPVAALPSEREAGPTAGFRKRRVLVVDDSQDAADTLATMIELAGHSATVAYDGFEALARAGDAPPDIAFCDIGMPGMDGYELAARLRAQPGLEALKLVAVTGWGSPQDERRARQAGFDLHLPKPASAAAIVAAIEG